jgi:gluconate 5-dehydrogenase
MAQAFWNPENRRLQYQAGAPMSMQGKVVLITGATNGIGKAAAMGLARLGAAVVVHGRDPAKLEATQAEISAG